MQIFLGRYKTKFGEKINFHPKPGNDQIVCIHQTPEEK
jgi:hypothetical protein